MKPRLVFSTLLAVIATFVAACGAGGVGSWQTPAVSPAAEQEGPALNLDSDSETIRLRMLYSHTTWQTLFVDGTYRPDVPGGTQAAHQQIWIDQATGRFRLVSGPENRAAESFHAADGQTVLEMDLRTGAAQNYAMAYDPAYFRPSPGVDDSIETHPLDGLVGTPFTGLLLPAGLAQRGGKFVPLDVEQYLEREALVADWFREDGIRPSRYWIDTQTGLILKAEEYGKGGSETVQSEFTVNQIVYNPQLPNDLFSLNPATVPGFSDALGTPQVIPGSGNLVASQDDSLGFVYFFVLDQAGGSQFRLVRLPGACLASAGSCPEPETIPTLYPLKFSASPLVWSPSGDLAAFSYPVNESGNLAQLFLFDPATMTWTPLAEYPYIDPPFWSPDGNWLAFRTQDGYGNEGLYAVRSDVTSLRDLTAGLPAEGRPYVLDGWIGENVIVRSGKPGAEGTVHLVNAEDGSRRPLFDTLLTKAAFTPAPDGSLLAYDAYDYTSRKHVLKAISPDGKEARDLATFQGGSIYPILWSPDGTALAFTQIDADANVADVYVISREGTNLRQVYRGAQASRLAFSPDGRFLLVEDSTAQGDQLFVVDLETLESRLLGAPGLRLDVRQVMPAWQK